MANALATVPEEAESHVGMLVALVNARAARLFLGSNALTSLRRCEWTSAVIEHAIVPATEKNVLRSRVLFHLTLDWDSRLGPDLLRVIVSYV